MNQRIELRQVTAGFRARWWIPVVLAALGATLGAVVNWSTPTTYRAGATVLVGPTNGASAQGSTVKASEGLAPFYADLARRQLVLQPVLNSLGLGGTWVALRDRVSASIPATNNRIISITASAPTAREATDIAGGVANRLVALSPAPNSGSVQGFVNDQVAELQRKIVAGEKTVASLQARLARADAAIQPDLRDQIATQEDLINAWQRNYVTLAQADGLDANAGAMQLLDGAAATSNQGRSGAGRLALAAGLVGLALGLVLAYVLHLRATRLQLRRMSEYHVAVGPPAQQRQKAGVAGAPTARNDGAR